MAIHVKVAETAKELMDVYRVRHQVYVNEEGYFRHSSLARSEKIVDCYDSFPNVANIIAYDEGRAVATMRVNFDIDGRLPPEEHFDFGACKRDAAMKAEKSGSEQPCFASAGMLAILREYRHRRDLFRALFKLSATVGEVQGTTHVIATVNARAEAIYRRFGFVALSEKFWVEDIGEYVIPMECDFRKFHEWAFGHMRSVDSDYLGMFASSLQRKVYSAGEVLFKEGDEAEEAYIIDEGVVTISKCNSRDHRPFTLVSLRSGDMFGELALIDQENRSADAVASSNVQVIVLPRAHFTRLIENEPDKARVMLRMLSERLRRMDDLALVLAYGNVQERIEFVMESLKSRAMEDQARPGWVMMKIGLDEVAKMAGVEQQDVRSYVEMMSKCGEISVGSGRIRFRTHHLYPVKLLTSHH